MLDVALMSVADASVQDYRSEDIDAAAASYKTVPRTIVRIFISEVFRNCGFLTCSFTTSIMVPSYQCVGEIILAKRYPLGSGFIN